MLKYGEPPMLLSKLLMMAGVVLDAGQLPYQMTYTFVVPRMTGPPWY